MEYTRAYVRLPSTDGRCAPGGCRSTRGREPVGRVDGSGSGSDVGCGSCLSREARRGGRQARDEVIAVGALLACSRRRGFKAGAGRSAYRHSSAGRRDWLVRGGNAATEAGRRQAQVAPSRPGALFLLLVAAACGHVARGCTFQPVLRLNSARRPPPPLISTVRRAAWVK